MSPPNVPLVSKSAAKKAAKKATAQVERARVAKEEADLDLISRGHALQLPVRALSKVLT